MPRRTWYPILGRDGELHPAITGIATGRSGVYAIRRASDGEVLYVGRSSTGQLRKRLLRHTQAANGFRGFVVDEEGGRRACEVCFAFCPPSAASTMEGRWTYELKPKHAQMVFSPGFGWVTRARAEDEDIPF